MTYIPPARGWARVGSLGVRAGSVTVFGYQHVGIGNAKVSQREWSGVAVEYRLYSSKCL